MNKYVFHVIRKKKKNIIKLKIISLFYQKFNYIFLYYLN